MVAIWAEAENSGGADGDGTSNKGPLWGRVIDVMKSDGFEVVVGGIVMSGWNLEEKV